MRYENRVRLGQVWKRKIFDMPFAWVKKDITRAKQVGWDYYEIVEKQSGGRWMPKYMFSIINDKYKVLARHVWWTKGTEIQQDMSLVSDKEAKTIKVLFGNLKGSCPAEKVEE